eukprot:COSAG06_NODE_18337_length_892_cov_1.631778_2_plen_198_part_01
MTAAAAWAGVDLRASREPCIENEGRAVNKLDCPAYSDSRIAMRRVRSGGLQAAAFHLAGAVMSHCPASGIAPCPDGVKNPSDASARGRTRSLSCSPSNLRGRQGGQPACRSHIASWSMMPHAHCSQQQAVAARPTTRSSSLFVSTFLPPLRHRHGFTACSVAGRHRRLRWCQESFRRFRPRKDPLAELFPVQPPRAPR